MFIYIFFFFLQVNIIKRKLSYATSIVIRRLNLNALPVTFNDRLSEIKIKINYVDYFKKLGKKC